MRVLFQISASIILAVTPLITKAESTAPYFGAKIGTVDIGSEFEEPKQAGVFVGYPINPNAAIEIEYTTSIEEASLKGLTDFDYEVEIESIAIYAAFRSQGELYFKGRFGYIKNKYTTTISNLEILGETINTSDSDTEDGLSFGFGLGYFIGQSSSLDFEYTQLDHDVEFMSLGFSHHF